MALPTDPEKAHKLGESWGKVLANSIFGVADIIRDGKEMKRAANAKMLQQNAITAAKNAQIRAKNEAYLKQKQDEIIMNMSHSEREAYKQIMKEQRISSTVKKAQHDEMISIGQIMIIFMSVLAVVGLVFFAAVFFGMIRM
jgi:hypothetical protein